MTGPPHVEGHHRAEQQAEEGRIGALHPLEPARNRGERGGHRFADHVVHQQPDEGGAEQRQDQHRLQTDQRARQRQVVADELDDITGEEPGGDAAEKPRADGAGDHAADHTRRDVRPVGDGIGDEAGQNRHHQREA